MTAYRRLDDLQSPAGWLPVPGSAPGPTLGNEYGKPFTKPKGTLEENAMQWKSEVCACDDSGRWRNYELGGP